MRTVTTAMLASSFLAVTMDVDFLDGLQIIVLNVPTHHTVLCAAAPRNYHTPGRVPRSVYESQLLRRRTTIVWFLSEVTKQPSRKDRSTMADELRIGLSELLRKAMIEQDAAFLKEGIRMLSQALMEMEVEEQPAGGGL
jgi:hypothetical protein